MDTTITIIVNKKKDNMVKEMQNDAQFYSENKNATTTTKAMAVTKSEKSHHVNNKHVFAINNYILIVK